MIRDTFAHEKGRARLDIYYEDHSVSYSTRKDEATADQPNEQTATPHSLQSRNPTLHAFNLLAGVAGFELLNSQYIRHFRYQYKFPNFGFWGFRSWLRAFSRSAKMVTTTAVPMAWGSQTRFSRFGMSSSFVQYRRFVWCIVVFILGCLVLVLGQHSAPEDLGSDATATAIDILKTDVLNDHSYFTRPKDIVGSTYLQCYSERGNIDHYYHFFFSCFVPLLVYHHEHPLQEVVLCSSHIGFRMAAILNVVLPKVPIIRHCKPSRIRLKAFDGNYGSDVKLITPWERDYVIGHLSSLVQSTDNDRFKVLLIGRMSVQRQRESKVERADTTGAQRRSIQNFDVLEKILQEQFGEGVLTVYLEEHTILEQFSFFRNAQVIIAQHGAALANTLFVDSNYTKGIIEISPYSKNFREGKFTHALPDCFKYIAKLVNISYTRIVQKGEFSEIDELLVLKEARKLLGS
jgi:hypothetical protein